jgi:protein CLEC16A
MKNINYIEKHEEQCKDVIQYLIDYLIYGDKHDSNIFDLFCEYNFMNEFVNLSNLNHRSMNLQIIKSMATLISSLSNTTTIYYIFSNNFINHIIANDYEKYDEDFLFFYVNFIKSLSAKIDANTIQFFYHKQLNSFPLLQAALKLYNHTDPMLRNTVRNIILTVMRSKKLY